MNLLLIKLAYLYPFHCKYSWDKNSTHWRKYRSSKLIRLILLKVGVFSSFRRPVIGYGTNQVLLSTIIFVANFIWKQAISSIKIVFNLMINKKSLGMLSF